MARGARPGRAVALTVVALGALATIEGQVATPPVPPDETVLAAATSDSPLFIPPPVRLVASTVVSTPVTTSAPAAARPSKAQPKASRPKPVTRTRPRAAEPKPSSTGEPIVRLGTIEIPKIGLVHDLYHGSTLANIDRGPSHMVETAMPGEPGNTAVGGHRVTHTRPFRNIHLLAPGDAIILNVNGKQSVYATTEAFVVTPDRIDILDPTPTPMATLFACHPPGSARYRYVVRALLVG